MKKFLRSHPNIVIGTLAAVFVVVLASFYFWAIDNVFDQMGRALTAPSTQSAVGFNLSGASKLDLRGLVSGNSDDAASTPTSAPASVTAPVSAPASIMTTTTAATSATSTSLSTSTP
jgi:hypothetical protein